MESVWKTYGKRMGKNGMKIKAVLFDKDGTLFDFHATWGGWARRTLMQLSRGDEHHARILGAVIGYDFDSRSFKSDSLVVAGTNEEIAQALSEKLPPEEVDTLMSDFATATFDAEMVEAVALRPLLSELKDRGLKLGVATNDNEGPARAHLEAAGVAGFFDFIAGFDSGHGGKPEPGMMLAFSQAAGIAPENVLMVGDSTHDLTAGREAGMMTAAVLTGPAQKEELAGYADVVLADIGHLPRWLDEHC